MSDYDSGFILGVFAGIVLSFLLLYLYVRSLIRKVMTEIDQQIGKVKEKLMPVTIERVNGQLFCYTEEDKQFICQGANMKEIKKAFEARFPDTTAFLSSGEEELLKDLRNQLKEINEASNSK